ncbi:MULTISPECIES: amino acid deaminase/aldolase [unclassified Gordonia (in: high G+C Gram-positive bacteria)]|uniref:amino acid deaminase/aldolase n=1 Tax=unclassified Gordonia (in: high G+C Gram-positive bacteria) TaxID=2657482 RepID=UPI0009AD058B|nr:MULTISPECIES: amino acid deaminase/aldolase [unclassified Gordonia (in: high G+C Gram-positive bacteria)]MDF3283236.1 amino acid deaminase/aldolase [Gordonia sp. N1V]OPX15180.1 alanine racemase [Gordonia sp. i37]
MTTLDLGSVTARSGVGYGRLARATADLEPPFAVVDVGALRANADSLVSRAIGKPVRLASKSVRCRPITHAVLQRPGFRGVLALTLAEALWLASDVQDVVVGYPTADVTALRQLATDAELLSRVTLMIDDVDQLDLIESVTPDGPPIRVCIDLDASLRLLGGRVHLGVRRSPVHSPQDAVALARSIVDRPRFRLVGVMAYEGQIAGVGDNVGSILHRLQIRGMQMVSGSELRERRAAAVAAVSEVADLEFVNGGGTGSIELTASEPAVTEVAAGSGLYCPTLFDTYRGFRPQPAAFYVMSVVRKPTPDYATVLGGGWVASGAAGSDRLPTPSWPRGLSLIELEGAGEAQTPLHGPGAAALSIGDRVWFRHAKAGELCERVNELHLVDGDQVIATVPTYRGEGKAFL